MNHVVEHELPHELAWNFTRRAADLPRITMQYHEISHGVTQMPQPQIS